jgi:tRNA(His) 5'-end guanylyltransferase
MSETAIDTRMKEQYENRFRFMLPRRSYTIIRVDGRAFHTWTRGSQRPYDIHLMEVMDRTALELCGECAGAQMAYVQSDEISLLLTDFAKDDTAAWFDNNMQKLCSISASVATAWFNRDWAGEGKPLAHFDSRVFQIPDPVEVENYFIARQKDAVRNSVAMLAQHYCSHKELHQVKVEQMHDKIHEHGDNWNDHPVRFKHGAAVVKMPVAAYMKETKVGLIEIPEHDDWKVVEPPVFTKDREWLKARIPVHR